jgi:hypothetical protein
VQVAPANSRLLFNLAADFNNSSTIIDTEVMATVSADAGQDTWFEQDLTAGTYYVNVSPSSNVGSTAYRLELISTDLPADPQGDPGDTIATAREIGLLTDRWSTEE